jgi:hypothetical protein
MKKKLVKKADVADNIFNTHIGMDVHAEYIELYGKISATLSKEVLLAEAKKLLLKRTPLEEKKTALVCLAHGNNLRSLYAIQKYLRNPDPELAAWASLAWQECQNAVLNEGMSKLMGSADAEKDLIIGGMGGERDRMRCCFVISTIGGRVFTKPEREKINTTLKKVDKHYAAKAEHLDWGDNYVKITALTSWEVAVGDYIEDLINQCNALSPFLRFHYFVVNTHDLTTEEIAKYLRGIKHVM